MSDKGDVVAVLDEHPELRDALEAVQDVDERNATWTFDDVAVDSGSFGELVSNGIVEPVNDEYRIADPDATGAALAGDDTDQPPVDTDRSLYDVQWPRPTVDTTAAAALTAALAFVALVRSHPIQSVYRGGDVLLSGNDPYYYRYWVERVFAESRSVFNLEALAALPADVTKGEPLLIATLWWASELLGETPAVVGDVMAWYPVISAVLTGLLVYLLAVTVTGDRRVGLAAVLLFAIVPGHALRTSLGYADHHAFDYLWLALTALTLTVLAGTNRDALARPRTWLAAVGLGVAIAGQTLAWDSSPLLLGAAGLGVVAISLAAVDTGRSPLIAGVPVSVGLALATGLAGAGHIVVGWHTARVGFGPAVVLGGGIVALAVAEIVHRTTGDTLHLLAIDILSFPIALAVFRSARRADWRALTSGTERLTAERDIAETVGLFDPNSLGVLLLLGLTLVIALPSMITAVRRAQTELRWAVPTAYVWYFFGLSTLSVRFVGELTPILAVFAGIGFVRIGAWIDTIDPIDFDRANQTRPPLTVPDRQTLGTLCVLFLIVGSLGMVQVPVKTSQVTIEESTYQSATFIENSSTQLNQSYPDNYVLSQWGRNRVYNYFVNGQSENYGFARQHYVEFISSRDADQWHDEFERRVGYVVIDDRINSNASSVQSHLTTEYGSRTARSDGVAHFRARYVTSDDTKIIYQVVPGAILAGRTSSNATVTLRTTVTIPGATFTYERQTVADAEGKYSVRVAHPGQYVVTEANETREPTVGSEAVHEGHRVFASSGSQSSTNNETSFKIGR